MHAGTPVWIMHSIILYYLDQSGSNHNEELRHRRELVAQQNQDFADSLNIDREKVGIASKSSLIA